MKCHMCRVELDGSQISKHICADCLAIETKRVMTNTKPCVQIKKTGHTFSNDTEISWLSHWTEDDHDNAGPLTHWNE